MLELREIYKYYNPGTVNEMCLFNNFNFKVDDGEFVAVVGSNGSGKTSMLNIICGSIPIDEGAVLINGTNITNMPEYKRIARNRRVFHIPSMATFQTLTILENMSKAEKKRKAYNLGKGVNKKREEAYRELLRPLNLGLEDKLHVKVGALSGGQRQAMSLLMSTMTPLDFLILDEHTAALDPKTAEINMRLTDQIVRGKKLTSIMVTHNLRYAIEYGTRIVMMHQGKVILDKKGEEKKNMNVDDVLDLFNEISIECGN